MNRIYFASKLKHGQKWQDLCANNQGFIAHARWLKHNVMGTEDSAENAGEFWLQDEQDVQDADVVIVYAAPEDHLRGALVEAGIAIANNVPVIVVGEHPDYGTWQHHPGVSRAESLTAALIAAIRTPPRYRRRGTAND